MRIRLFAVYGNFTELQLRGWTRIVSAKAASPNSLTFMSATSTQF